MPKPDIEFAFPHMSMRNGEGGVQPVFKDYFEQFGIPSQPLPSCYDEYAIQVALRESLGMHTHPNERVMLVEARNTEWLPNWFTQMLAASKVASSLHSQLEQPQMLGQMAQGLVVPEIAKDMVVVAYQDNGSAVLFKPRDEAETALMVETQLTSNAIEVLMATSAGAYSPVDGLPRITTKVHSLLQLTWDDFLSQQKQMPFSRLVDTLIAYKRKACGAILHSEEIHRAYLNGGIDIDTNIQRHLRGVPNIDWVFDITGQLWIDFAASGWRGDPTWKQFMDWVNELRTPENSQARVLVPNAAHHRQSAVLQM